MEVGISLSNRSNKNGKFSLNVSMQNRECRHPGYHHSSISNQRDQQQTGKESVRRAFVDLKNSSHHVIT
jgi:hypothetical protein